MKLFPSIDVKDGHPVRMNKKGIGQHDSYSVVPLDTAAAYEAQNAHCLHVVDLDGAQLGYAVNDEIIKEIIRSVSIPVQVGGGVRSIQDIEHKLNLGADQVVLGTMAVSNPAFVKEAVSIFGAERILVAIDVQGNHVTQNAWSHASGYDAVEFAYKMKAFGIDTVLYANVNKEGNLLSASCEGARQLQSLTGLNVIVSGSLNSLTDLERLQRFEVYGAVIRDYMYMDDMSLGEMIEMFDR